jgi:ATP-dependent Lhr-like helicase
LARIHRLTLDGLRRQIQPVTTESFVRFLVRRHHLLPDDQWGGAVGVREAVHALQGFELPAGAWEANALSARVHQYGPDWLDQLFAAGETTWGRLSSPRRSVDNGRNLAALTRSVPISLQLREDLGWLLPMDRPPTEYPLSTYAQTVQEALCEHGALFTQDLKAVTGLLDAHLDEALCQLAALGMVTSDTFDAIRRITSVGNRARRARRGHSGTRVSVSGRWSRFPGPVKMPQSEEHVERWCHQLLRRWGVVFRDLMARESAAPPWRMLAATFRNMERRGVIRGGRFVAQVGGEQFGEPSAVDSLRKTADDARAEPWIAVSAVDPLNLVGIISSDRSRIPAIHTNSLILWQGRCIAARQSGETKFYETVDPTTSAEMTRALYQSRRPTASRLFSAASQR